jgi:Transketolase, pyrimidine binding domain
MGEDGPTHQPVEQMASLRAMPGLVDLRPADANEIRAAWSVLMPITDRPVALMLTKQEVPVLDRSRYAPADGLARGAYVLADPPGGERPDAIRSVRPRSRPSGALRLHGRGDSRRRARPAPEPLTCRMVPPVRSKRADLYRAG